jgi:tetratricopeptide (TPR) repeat protein
VRYKPIAFAIGGEMEESVIEDVEEIDTIIAELEISKGKGNLILCVVNSPAYRERIIQTLSRRFLSEVIYVEKGEQIIHNLKSKDFDGADVLIWVMPEEPTEDLLDTLNNFRELFYEAKIPNLMFYNQAFSESVIRKAPDFWRYRGNYYELKEAERGMAFEAIETLATPFSYQDKEDLLRRKRINEYLLERVRDKEEKAKIQGELGVIFYYLGELDKASEYYEKALKLEETLETKEGMAAVLGNIGAAYFTKGELDKALKYFEKALKIFEDLGIKEGMANQLGNIGALYFSKGELDKASGSYKKALKIFEESGIKEGIVTLLGNIGALYFTKGEPDKALEYLRKVLELHEVFGSKEGLAKNFENIGTLYSIKGELDKALEYYEQALGIFGNMGMRIEIARTLMNIGDVFVQKGDKERALEYYQKAEGLATGSSVFKSVSERLKRLKEKQKPKDAQQNT